MEKASSGQPVLRLTPRGSFDLVVSTSTLDHFGHASDIGDALAELNRVLRKGGELVITMDNTGNPVIALRRIIQAPLL